MTKPVDFFFHLSWAEWTQHSDAYVTFVIRATGIVLMVAGGAALWVKPSNRRMGDLLVVSFFLMACHAFGVWHEKDWQIGMILEMQLQTFMPILLLVVIWRGVKTRAFLWCAIVAAAVTFVGHGLYAMGHHPVPAEFITMSMNILGMSEPFAKTFLRVAGYMDFVVAFLLFAPVRVVRVLACGYMVSWGFFTALARVLANYNPGEKFRGIDPWVAETLVRTSHWAIPLMLLLLFRKSRDQALTGL